MIKKLKEKNEAKPCQDILKINTSNPILIIQIGDTGDVIQHDR